MKRNIKLFLLDWLVAMIVIAIGFSISKTFLCGMLCGIIYSFIADVISLYFKAKEEKQNENN